MSIRKRGNTWHCHLADEAIMEVLGKPFRKSLGTSDKATARVMERKIRQDILKGVYGNQGSEMTLKAAITRAYRDHWQHGKSADKMHNRLMVIQELLGADTPLSKITKQRVQAMIQTCREQGNAESTINRKIAAVSKLLNIARDDWDLDVPSFRIKKAKETNKIVWLSHEAEAEVTGYFREAGDMQMLALVCLLVDTGLRLGEALAIGRESYPYTAVDGDVVRVWTNKGDKPRSVPLTSRAAGWLNGLGSIPFDGLNDESVRGRWKKMKRKTGLEYTIHDLRHTTASRLVQAGVDLYVVKEYLGHSSIKVTEGYAHLNEDNLKAAKDVLEQAGAQSRAQKLRVVS